MTWERPKNYPRYKWVPSAISVDKLDPLRPYTLENIIFVRSEVNARKCNVTYKDCKKIVSISSHDLVIDIGSNDGNLLKNFRDNHRVLGITPEKIGKLAIKKGIKTLIRYFDKNTFVYTTFAREYL